MFTPNHIEQFNKIVDKHIAVFNGRYISPDLLNTQEKSVLRQAGIDWKNISPQDTLVYQAFASGMMSGVIPKATLNDVSLPEFRKYLTSGKFIPLNSYEQAVVRSLESQSLSDVRGIKNRFVDKATNQIQEANRKFYEDTIRKEIQEGRARKDTTRIISSEINKALGDFSRDFDRVVQYVSNSAFQHGRAAFYERNYGDNAKVYKNVYQGACKHCIRLYLTAGLGSKPRLFSIEELKANGTNIGRKTAEWLPTLDSTHPFCRCTLEVVPDGYIWDEDSNSFKPNKNFERKVKRKSKVNFSFRDKEYSI